MGVDHFFLYDNQSGDDAGKVLEPFVSAGWVTLRPWPFPFPGSTVRVYADCLERVRGSCRWLACVDLDEFLFSPRDSTLVSVLRDFESHPGVVVRWQCYGSSGQARRTAEPVIARFCRRSRTDWIRNRRVKSIVDPERAVHALNPHYFVYRDGALAVTENGAAVHVTRRASWKPRLRRLFALLGPLLQYVDPYALTDITDRKVSVERLRINHYPIKSREEFERKSLLKNEKRRYDGVDYFGYHDRNEVFDPILDPYVPSVAATLARLA
jgi:hypothetical protein